MNPLFVSFPSTFLVLQLPVGWSIWRGYEGSVFSVSTCISHLWFICAFCRLVSYSDVSFCKDLCTDFSKVTWRSELFPNTNPLYVCFTHMYSAVNCLFFFLNYCYYVWKIREILSPKVGFCSRYSRIWTWLMGTQGCDGTFNATEKHFWLTRLQRGAV